MSEKMCAAPFSFFFFPREYQNPRPHPKERGKRKDLQKTKERKTTTVQNPKRGGWVFHIPQRLPPLFLFPSLQKNTDSIVLLALSILSLSLSLSLARSQLNLSPPSKPINISARIHNQPGVSRLNTKVRGGEIIQDE